MLHIAHSIISLCYQIVRSAIKFSGSTVTFIDLHALMITDRLYETNSTVLGGETE